MNNNLNLFFETANEIISALFESGISSISDDTVEQIRSWANLATDLGFNEEANAVLSLMNDFPHSEKVPILLTLNTRIHILKEYHLVNTNLSLKG
ncbi:hypothetical protein [Pseudoalteromonas piratica]|uniref:Uncharacterized protein n=1 Tax=Pseudoalteromonas piratica TaxID=1348114 RepID=A0A0A7ED09_9GAMM|nr:hypothetical protein [Pseudoalteromonas piratica]AIY63922.1 hypothetical protein OM33_01180 [Pseudoalteromonas piratica]